MDTLTAIQTIMNQINFDTNEFHMPEDFFDRAKLQSAINHIQENDNRVKLFDDAMKEKVQSIIKSKESKDEATREG
jgi:hypothetical protein